MTLTAWLAPAARRVWMVALLAGLAACGGLSKPKPTALEPLTAKVVVELLWQSRVDSVEFPLSVGARDEQFAVASTQGKVSIIQSKSGQTVWSLDLGVPLQAALGFNGRKAAAITRDNDLVVAELGVSVSEGGLLLTAPTFMGAAAALWAGPMMDRHGRRPLVVGGLLLVGACNLLMALVGLKLLWDGAHMLGF